MRNVRHGRADDDLSIEEAAQFLRVEASAVEHAVITGVLPFRYRRGAPVLSKI